MTRGGKNFLKGVTEGISGVVMKPIRGAKDDGAVGFFKGVGKGLIGVVARPVSGSLDLVSTTAEGIKNQSKMKEEVRGVRANGNEYSSQRAICEAFRWGSCIVIIFKIKNLKSLVFLISR